MEYVAIAAAVMGAVGQVEAGYQRRQQYRLQAEQTRLQAEQKALEYTRQGNAVLDRINNANAAAAARAYAGGTMGFEGSSALVQAATERRGGRELLLTQEGAASARRYGFTQAALFEQAGDTAVAAGWANAAMSIGTAAYQYSKIGGPGMTQAPAPVTDVSATTTDVGSSAWARNYGTNYG